MPNGGESTVPEGRLDLGTWQDVLIALWKAQEGMHEILIKEIETLIERMAGTSEESELATIDLQNALQKSQQTLQMLSNVSKLLHDTAMALMRKIA
jgi:hypothetical protein